MSESLTFPGDRIASIEEYEAGQNAFDDGNDVRAAVVGITEIDKKERVVNVKNQDGLSIPKVGDIIIGTVAAVMGSMIAVSIDYINGRHTTSHVECVCSTRNLRKKNVALVNDIVCLKIISHLNGTIHATIKERNLGVLFTKCVKCGKKVIQMRDAVKCTECSWIDDRELSSDFGNSDFIKLSAK
ncbi:MAG TPA: exosome complex RNA-binding protein Csl4 [Nitrosopumilaceae archaeon]|nr:exosome complex RNA-binding protein Csl4 [Nitrosopumilaceae archaeon]